MSSLAEPINIIAKQENKKKTAINMVKARTSGGGGGGGGIGAGLLFLGGAVATATFIFLTRRRKADDSSKNCKKSPSPSTASEEIPYRAMEDKYMNEDKGLRFVAANSCTHLDTVDQELRNGTSSSGVQENENPMIPDVTAFFLDEKEKLGINGRNEEPVVEGEEDDEHSISLEAVKSIRQSDASALKKKEFQTPPPLVEEKTTLQKNEVAVKEIACIKEEENGHTHRTALGEEEDCPDVLMKIEGEKTHENRADDCDNSGDDIQEVAVVEKDEEEDGGDATTQILETREEHSVPFKGQGNGIDDSTTPSLTDITKENEALEGDTESVIQLPEEEKLKKRGAGTGLVMSEAVEEVKVQAEAETEKAVQQLEIAGAQIYAQEPEMDTKESSLEEDDSAADARPEIEQSGEGSEIEKEAGFGHRAVESGELPNQGAEEQEEDVDEDEEEELEEDEEAELELRYREERKLNSSEEEEEEMDESSTPEAESSADSSAESNAEPICPAESIQEEKVQVNDKQSLQILEYVQKLDGNGIAEKRLQKGHEEEEEEEDDDKGNLKFTLQLSELTRQTTNSWKGRRSLILTIMVFSGSLGIRYFGLSFLKVCLIIILTIILAKMHGI